MKAKTRNFKTTTYLFSLISLLILMPACRKKDGDPAPANPAGSGTVKDPKKDYGNLEIKTFKLCYNKESIIKYANVYVYDNSSDYSNDKRLYEKNSGDTNIVFFEDLLVRDQPYPVKVIVRSCDNVERIKAFSFTIFKDSTLSKKIVL